MLDQVRKATLIIVFLALLSFTLLSVEAEAESSKRPAGDSWATKTPMPEAAAGFEAADVKGKIYAMGGFNEEYNPATDTWTSKTPMPTRRSDFGIAAYNDKIYCIGGMTGFNANTGFNATGANEVYDPTTDTWETKTPMPTPRFNLRAIVTNNKIYLLGGTKQDPPENITIPHKLNWGQQISDVVEVYDPETDTWTTKNSMPTAVHSYASAVVGNKIYAISPTFTWIYETETDSWSQAASPPIPSVQAGGATSGVFAPQRIYVFSGNITQIYDLDKNAWTMGSSMPTNRNYPAIAILDDEFFVLGGWTLEPTTYGSIVNPFQQVFSAVNEEYTPVAYGTVPPEIMVLSPENMTYDSRSVSLNFTVNKPVDWLGCSLDEKENVTIIANTTVADLSSGQHNITLYANDTYGNFAASKTITFTIANSVSFPMVAVVIITAVLTSAAIGLGIAVKRKRHASEKPSNSADVTLNLLIQPLMHYIKEENTCQAP
jgi:N-acetylneuraminic acid mutarotase